PQPRAFEEAYKPIVETTAFLNRDNAKMEIDRVLKVFVKERKPVYIAIPMDIATLEISDRVVDYNWTSDSETLKIVIEKIADKIRHANKPVILGDTLIKRFDARIEYKEFVETCGIPATNFLMGTNLINQEYQNYLGTYFSKFRNPLAQEWLENTDCLIAVGAIYSDINASGFNLPYKINSHIAIYGTYTYIEGQKYDNIKMADVLEGLTNAVEPREFVIEKPEIGYKKVEVVNEKLTSNYIYPRIQEFLRPNDIIIAETGIIPNGVGLMKFPASAELHTQTLWGSIGWATPAALGASIANPHSRVILLTGEGSHQLTAMEVGNMLRQGVKPVIIVLNNNGYTIERILSNSPDDKFNDILQMNYSKFARVFEGDVWSTKAETEDDFDKALKVTQIMNKLCYIEICTDKMDTPEFTKEIFAGLKAEKKCNELEKQTETPTLTKDENRNYGTTIHESLRKGD
ncbi:MAG: thiamine pyrophosphate-dependent enzyme, partial [Muribaculaceae bacterium]|nr:thiamine pyrophosphate-dependent enzyme [Muribaculaceae bacterium]